MAKIRNPLKFIIFQQIVLMIILTGGIRRHLKNSYSLASEVSAKLILKFASEVEYKYRIIEL